jgi:hypothetical protein
LGATNSHFDSLSSIFFVCGETKKEKTSDHKQLEKEIKKMT